MPQMLMSFNAIITYSLDNSTSLAFDINSVPGVVSVFGQLDAAVIPVYSIVIVASDRTLSPMVF